MNRQVTRSPDSRSDSLEEKVAKIEHGLQKPQQHLFVNRYSTTGKNSCKSRSSTDRVSKEYNPYSLRTTQSRRSGCDKSTGCCSNSDTDQMMHRYPSIIMLVVEKKQ